MNPSAPDFDEELSACVDEAIERSRHRFAIKRLVDDAEARARWGRYHLIRAVCQRQTLASEDLSERIWRALDERTPESAPSALSARWLKPVAGGLIAASVAVVAVLGMNRAWMDESWGPQFDDGSGFVSQTTPMDRVFSQPATPVGFGGVNSDDQARLQRLLLQHNQAARGAGVGSYWPVVTWVPPVEAESSSEPSTDKP